MAIIWKLLLKRTLNWPKKVRNAGLVVLGYMLGSPFTPAVAHQVVQQLPLMLASTLLLIGLCLGTGYVSGRYTGVGLANSLMGSIPGGLSQMSVICEEIEGINLSVVTLMQTVRVLTVLFVVPLLALHGLADQVAATSRPVTHLELSQLPVLALFTLLILILVKLAKRIELSSVYVLAPVLGTASLVLAGVTAPVLPTPIVAVAQIVVGIKMGQDVDFGSLTNWKTIAFINFLSVTSVIAVLLGIAFAYSHIAPTSLVTAFISMAPGGISEMGLTAMAVNADLPTVVAYQLFRLLFILLVCVPVTRRLIQRKCASQH